MNPFDLKAALPAKHAAPHLACVVRSGAVTFLPPICYCFDNNKEYLTRSYSL